MKVRMIDVTDDISIFRGRCTSLSIFFPKVQKGSKNILYGIQPTQSTHVALAVPLAKAITTDFAWHKGHSSL